MQPSGRKKPQVFYINGDSWLANAAAKVANSNNLLFENILVINHAVPGSGNIRIIDRTRTALSMLSQWGVTPWVCIGLSEVGRDFEEEFKLVKPGQNLDNYLGSVLDKELAIVADLVKNCPNYITTGWLPSPNRNKSIIDFIGEDWNNTAPPYTISNGIYNWLDDRQSIFKISKESFVVTVNNKQRYEEKLLKNPYVNSTLHLNNSTSDEVYQKFFEHVFLSIAKDYDNYIT